MRPTPKALGLSTFDGPADIADHAHHASPSILPHRRENFQYVTEAGMIHLLADHPAHKVGPGLQPRHLLLITGRLSQQVWKQTSQLSFQAASTTKGSFFTDTYVSIASRTSAVEEARDPRWVYA